MFYIPVVSSKIMISHCHLHIFLCQVDVACGACRICFCFEMCFQVVLVILLFFNFFLYMALFFYILCIDWVSANLACSSWLGLVLVVIAVFGSLQKISCVLITLENCSTDNTVLFLLLFC